MAREFEVVGKLPFPTDMLRYDHCMPATYQDVEAIIRSFCDSYGVRVGGSQPYKVRLRIADEFDHFPSPTKARWSSFLWSVVPNEEEANVVQV